MLIDVDFDILVKRVVGRWTCKSCGEIFNTYFKAPAKEGVCDVDGGELAHRADDNAETIKSRLAVYEEQTAPLISYYGDKGLLKTIDGLGEIDEIFARMVDAVS